MTIARKSLYSMYIHDCLILGLVDLPGLTDWLVVLFAPAHSELADVGLLTVMVAVDLPPVVAAAVVTALAPMTVVAVVAVLVAVVVVVAFEEAAVESVGAAVVESVVTAVEPWSAWRPGVVATVLLFGGQPDRPEVAAARG